MLKSFSHEEVSQLNLSCIIYDSIKCFIILNPEFKDDDIRFSEYYELALRMQSDKIKDYLEHSKTGVLMMNDCNYSINLENEPLDCHTKSQFFSSELSFKSLGS